MSRLEAWEKANGAAIFTEVWCWQECCTARWR